MGGRARARARARLSWILHNGWLVGASKIYMVAGNGVVLKGRVGQPASKGSSHT